MPEMKTLFLQLLPSKRVVDQPFVGLGFGESKALEVV
jgi:hypothetical protein